MPAKNMTTSAMTLRHGFLLGNSISSSAIACCNISTTSKPPPLLATWLKQLAAFCISKCQHLQTCEMQSIKKQQTSTFTLAPANGTENAYPNISFRQEQESGLRAAVALRCTNLSVRANARLLAALTNCSPNSTRETCSN